MESNNTKVLFRASLKVRSGKPGHSETECHHSNWYDTANEAKKAGLQLYDDVPEASCERNRHTFIEKKEVPCEKNVEKKEKSLLSQRDKDLAFAKKRAIECLERNDKQQCIMSFLSDASKWNLFPKESTAWQLLMISMLNPSIINRSFIEGFN